MAIVENHDPRSGRLVLGDGPDSYLEAGQLVYELSADGFLLDPGMNDVDLGGGDDTATLQFNTLFIEGAPFDVPFANPEDFLFSIEGGAGYDRLFLEGPWQTVPFYQMNGETLYFASSNISVNGFEEVFVGLGTNTSGGGLQGLRDLTLLEISDTEFSVEDSDLTETEVVLRNASIYFSNTSVGDLFGLNMALSTALTDGSTLTGHAYLGSGDDQLVFSRSKIATSGTIDGGEGRDQVIFWDVDDVNLSAIENVEYIAFSSDDEIGDRRDTRVSGTTSAEKIDVNGTYVEFVGVDAPRATLNVDGIVEIDESSNFLRYQGFWHDDVIISRLADTIAAPVHVGLYFGNDVFDGRDALAAFSVVGGDGDDAIYLGYGGGWADGENGDDELSAAAVDPGTQVQLFGGSGDDLLTGHLGIDDLAGGEGNDHIDGGGGDDRISGGPGNDFLRGGDGRDEFHDGASEFAGDTIADFNPLEDRIYITDGTVRGDAVELDEEGTVTLSSDGILISQFNLGLSSADGNLIASRTLAETTDLRFVNYLPKLREHVAVDDGLINEIVVEDYLLGRNSSAFSVVVESSEADFDNLLGYYIALPGTGSNAKVGIIATNVKLADAPFIISGVGEEQRLGFFIIPNGANLDYYVDGRSVDADALASMNLTINLHNNPALYAYGEWLGDLEIFVDQTARPERVPEQALSGVSDDGTGSLRIAFEDTNRNFDWSDGDFQDVVFSVTALSDAEALIL